MSALKPNTAAQKVMSAFFTWNFNDTMENTLGDSQDFGSANVAAVAGTPDADSYFTVIYLPPNAVVVGGALQVLTSFDTAGYDIVVGDLDDPDEYLATADRKTAGVEVPLVPTGITLDSANETAITIGIANDDVCTAGKAVLRVDYIINGRAEEVNHAAV
jgi:hypothetical protein